MAGMTLDAPALRKIVEDLAAIIRQDYILRGLQAGNAPLAKYPNYGTVLATALTVPVPQQLTPGNEVFSWLQVTFSDASGAGFYSVTLDVPTATGTTGFPIPAGGGTLWIPGMANIKNFKVIAATGQTMPFAAQLFV